MTSSVANSRIDRHLGRASAGRTLDPLAMYIDEGEESIDPLTLAYGGHTQEMADLEVADARPLVNPGRFEGQPVEVSFTSNGDHGLDEALASVLRYVGVEGGVEQT
jgi:hypothetical protein